MTDGRPRFPLGDTGRLGGFQWRIIKGRKWKDDRVIECLVPRWSKVTFFELALQVDFLYQNEDRGFPPTVRGMWGGEKLMNHLRLAVDEGYVMANERLDYEKRRKAGENVEEPLSAQSCDICGSRKKVGPAAAVLKPGAVLCEKCWWLVARGLREGA